MLYTCSRPAYPYPTKHGLLGVLIGLLLPRSVSGNVCTSTRHSSSTAAVAGPVSLERIAIYASPSLPVPRAGPSFLVGCAGPDDAPPILLIHGFGASVGHFRKNFPALVGAGYRVYAIDLLGFGASDKPKDVEVNAGVTRACLTRPHAQTFLCCWDNVLLVVCSCRWHKMGWK